MDFLIKKVSNIPLFYLFEFDVIIAYAERIIQKILSISVTKLSYLFYTIFNILIILPVIMRLFSFFRSVYFITVYENLMNMLEHFHKMERKANQIITEFSFDRRLR